MSRWIKRRVVRTSQPQDPVQLLPDADMAVAISPIGGGLGFRSLKGSALTVTGTLATQASALGVGKRGGTGNYLSAASFLTSTSTISLIIVLVPKSIAVGDDGIFSLGNSAISGTPRVLIQQNGTYLKFFWANAYKLTVSSAVAVDKPMVIGFTHDGTTGKCFIDGVMVGSAAAVLGGDTGTNWYLGSGYNTQHDAIYLEHFQWTKALPEQRMISLTQNPWQLFEPIPRNIWVPVSAGGGTTISLLTSSYSWTKNTQQLLLNSNFSASTLNFSAQSTQNVQVINTTTGTLTETPQSIQNRLDLFLTKATQAFTPATIAVSLSIGLGSAFLYFIGQGIEVTGAIAVVNRLLALMGVGS